MKKVILALSSILAVSFTYSVSSFAKENARNVASSPCTVAQVMKTVREKKAYEKFEYASDYDGDAKGLPTQKRNENSDQYTFWVDKDGTSYLAIVTYDSGRCTGGKSTVKTKDGE